MVCSQTKILTSAFFGLVLLKSHVTRQQAFALCVLVLGMVLVQIDDDATRTTTTTQPLEPGSSFRGLLFVCSASVISGFVGAYLEKMYKEVDFIGMRRSIWFRNVQLAIFSVPLAAFTSYWRDGDSTNSNGVFQGYDIVVLLIVALHAIGGLIVAAVMRYASNVLKCFAVSLSICNCVIATTHLFGDGEHSLSAMKASGICLVISATFAYSLKKNY